MLYYKASCTSAEFEFQVAGVHTSRSSNRQKPEVQLSTSSKRGFCLKLVPLVSSETGNPA